MPNTHIKWQIRILNAKYALNEIRISKDQYTLTQICILNAKYILNQIHILNAKYTLNQIRILNANKKPIKCPVNDINLDFEKKNNKICVFIRRSVRSCSQTIPEKVRNSRPINMGFKGWG